jgi:hypothetical protein
VRTALARISGFFGRNIARPFEEAGRELSAALRLILACRRHRSNKKARKRTIVFFEMP